MQDRAGILISFITPVYNAEKHLKACLDSLAAQKGDDIEFVLTDDGSLDRSSEMLDEFASRDSRARVIHKPNGGVSSARNAALEICAGRWLCFVDADDVISENLVSRVRGLLTESRDALFFSWNRFGRDDQKDISEDIPSGEHILSDDELNRVRLTALCPSGSLQKTAMRFRGGRGVFGYMARADIVKRENIRFDDGMKLAEDVVFRLKYLSFCKNAACVSDVLYHYRISDSSLLHGYSDIVHSDVERAIKELKNTVSAYYCGNRDMEAQYLAAVVLESRLYLEKFLFHSLCQLSESEKTAAYDAFRREGELQNAILNCDIDRLQSPVDSLLKAYRVKDPAESMLKARAALKNTASPVRRILTRLGLTAKIKQLIGR